MRMLRRPDTNHEPKMMYASDFEFLILVSTVQVFIGKSLSSWNNSKRAGCVIREFTELSKLYLQPSRETELIAAELARN